MSLESNKTVMYVLRYTRPFYHLRTESSPNSASFVSFSGGTSDVMCPSVLRSSSVFSRVILQTKIRLYLYYSRWGVELDWAFRRANQRCQTQDYHKANKMHGLIICISFLWNYWSYVFKVPVLLLGPPDAWECVGSLVACWPNTDR